MRLSCWLLAQPFYGWGAIAQLALGRFNGLTNMVIGLNPFSISTLKRAEEF